MAFDYNDFLTTLLGVVANIISTWFARGQATPLILAAIATVLSFFMLVSYCVENLLLIGNRRNQRTTLFLTLVSFALSVSSAATFTLPSSCDPPNSSTAVFLPALVERHH